MTDAANDDAAVVTRVNALLRELNADAPLFALARRDEWRTADALARRLLAVGSAKELFLHATAHLAAEHGAGNEPYCALLLGVLAVVVAQLTRRTASYRASLADLVADVAVVARGSAVSATIFAAVVALLRSVARSAVSTAPFVPLDEFGAPASLSSLGAADDAAIAAQQWVVATVMRVFAATVAPFDASVPIVRVPTLRANDASGAVDSNALSGVDVPSLISVLVSSSDGLGASPEYLLQHYDRVTRWHHKTHDRHFDNDDDDAAAADDDNDVPPAQPDSLQWSALGYATFLLHAGRSPLWPSGVWSPLRQLRTALAAATAVTAQLSRNAQQSVEMVPGAIGQAYQSEHGGDDGGGAAPLHAQERRPLLIALELVRELCDVHGVGVAAVADTADTGAADNDAAAALLVTMVDDSTTSFDALESPACGSDAFGVDSRNAWHALQSFAQTVELFAVSCSDADVRFHCLDTVRRLLLHLVPRDSFTLLRRMLLAATSASWHEALVGLLRERCAAVGAVDALARARTCALLDAALRRIEIEQAGRKDAHAALLDWTSSMQALFALVAVARRRNLLVGDSVIAFHRRRFAPLRRALKQCADEANEQLARSADDTSRLVQNARHAGVEHASHATLHDAARHTLQQCALIDCAFEFAFA